MASVVKFVVLLCAVVAASASPIILSESDIDEILIDDLIQTFAAKDQTLVIGHCTPTDRLLYSETVYVRSTMLRHNTQNVVYPAQGSAGQEGVITCIKVIDELRTGKNGVVSITNGGLGQRYAILNIRSGRGDPIKYAVQIYGYL